MFQIINNLFYSKKDIDACEDYETQQNFQPYMINRWLSFYSKDLALFTNETLNKYSQVRDNKTDTFKMYFNLIPRLKFKRISYMKKPAKKKKKETENLELFASNHDVSVREVKNAVAFYNTYCK